MITLKSPSNEAKINLLTDIQINFLASNRSDVSISDFDWLDLKRDDTSDCSFPNSITFEWDADTDGVIQISEDEHFKTYFTLIGNQFCRAENFKCGTRYFWRVVSENEISDIFYFDTEDKYPRFIKIDGLTNIRDCGGRKTVTGQQIKQGLLYRGSEMNSHVNITADGINTMKNVLKITSVLDLRGDTEDVRDIYKGIYINIPVRPYSEWFLYPNTMKQIFEFLSDEQNYPVYFHCWGGADRTGTLAFLLGAILGQSYEDLIDDYEITSLSVWGIRSRNSENLCKSFLEKFNSFEGETTCEKATNYILSCGISETLIEKFKQIMIL